MRVYCNERIIWNMLSNIEKNVICAMTNNISLSIAQDIPYDTVVAIMTSNRLLLFNVILEQSSYRPDCY